MKHQLILASLLVVATLVSVCCDGGSESPRVVLYASADDHIARDVIAAFERRTGVRVDFVGDIEQKKTTGLVQRLRAEADHPQADVFWSSEVFMTIKLAEEGVLGEYESPATENWPRAFRDPKGRWYGFAARARVIAYAPDRVAADDLPQSWMDLTDSHWKGRVVMADPRFGTTGGHLGAMKAYWSSLVAPAYYNAFLLGLAENDLRLLPSGNAGVVRAIVSGEADLGPTDTDDVWAAQARGYNVKLIYPRHGLPGALGAGTLVIPNTVALVKDGPHPTAAGQLIDFLLSRRVERMLAESVSSNIPINAEVAALFPQYTVPDPLKIDFRRAAAMMNGAVEQAMRTLDQDDAPDAP